MHQRHSRSRKKILLIVADAVASAIGSKQSHAHYEFPNHCLLTTNHCGKAALFRLSSVAACGVLSSNLHRRLALFPGDFSNEFRYEVAGEFCAYLRDEFAGAFITDLEMGNTFRVVELMQIVGEHALLE